MSDLRELLEALRDRLIATYNGSGGEAEVALLLRNRAVDGLAQIIAAVPSTPPSQGWPSGEDVAAVEALAEQLLEWHQRDRWGDYTLRWETLNDAQREMWRTEARAMLAPLGGKP